MEKSPNEEIVQKTINDLQRKIKDAYLVDDFDAMNELNGRMLKIASQLTNPKHIQAVSSYHQKVNLILKQRRLYASMISQISEIFRPQQKGTNVADETHRRLELLEEEFRNAFIDRNFRICQEKLPEILDMAIMLNDQGKINNYLNLKEFFAHAAPEPQEVAESIQKTASPKPIPPIPKEKLLKIEELKKSAIDLEGRLEFQQAKAIYQEMMQVATEIEDRLTVALCDQMIAQIGIWEEEIEKSDFTKFDIPPFRLVNRARFDCLEAMGDKGAANKKMENLISLGVKPETIKVITISRSKFKGKSPYNKNGECFAIYIRRSFD